MSVDGSLVGDDELGSERLVTGAINLLTDASNSWARMVIAGSASWSSRSPPLAYCALMWWLPPEAVTFVDGGEGLLYLKVVCQVAEGSDSGHLYPIKVLIHSGTGGARIDHIGSRLVGLEPGLMAPLPYSVCKLLDWLWFGYRMRTADRHVWDEDEDEPVDDNLVFDSGSFLRFLTFNRSSTTAAVFGRRFGVRETILEHVERGDAEGGLPIARPVGDAPVRVRAPRVAGVVVHQAAFARGQDSTDSSSDGSDSEVEVISISS